MNPNLRDRIRQFKYEKRVAEKRNDKENYYMQEEALEREKFKEIGKRKEVSHEN